MKPLPMMPGSSNATRPTLFPVREILTQSNGSEPPNSSSPSPPDDYLVEDLHHDNNKTPPVRKESSGSKGGSFWRTADDRSTTPSNVNTSLAHAKKTPSSADAGRGGNQPEIRTTNKSRSTGMLGGAPPVQVPQRSLTDNSIRRADSDRSSTGGSAGKDSKKNLKKQRSADLRRKHDSSESEHNERSHGSVSRLGAVPLPPPTGFAEMSHNYSLDRSSSDQSTGSLLYGKTPNTGAILGKSSSLIFPTGVETTTEGESEVDSAKRRKINLLLDQCEAIRFPFKKKLMLEKLGITAVDIPLNYLCGTPLGNSLYKLSLSGNRLGNIPPKLVQTLPALRHLDLSQCELHHLPSNWSLPQLKKLNLGHNRLKEFPDESILGGLPELMDLNMYGNKVSAIIVPKDKFLLSKLEVLNLGYNDLGQLPNDLDRLRNLKSLKLMNNFLEKVPMRVCEMDLKTIDVSFNPVIQPPLETCERGISSMRRYYHCLKLEEQSKHKIMEEAQKRLTRQKKREKDATKKKGYASFLQKVTKSGSPHASKHSVDDSMQAKSPVPPSASYPKVEKTPTTASSAFKLKHSTSQTSELRKTTSSSFDTRTDSGVGDVQVETKEEEEIIDPGKTVNDTLKVIFVGMAMVGKTSMIKRLIEGEDAVIPTHVERTVGVDIYAWDPKKDTRFEHIDSRIEFQDKELADTCGDVDVKFSVWDFAGQHVYHATHELFFSSRALYVLVWDMGATNRATLKRKPSVTDEKGAFKLSYDSESEEDEKESDDFADEEERRRADRALERDIDEKVQFWIDCIQSSAPGAAILPVASFNDYFSFIGGETEARRRCNILKNRLLKHEERRMEGLRLRLQGYVDENRPDDPAAHRLRKLLCSYTRPSLIFGEGDDSVVRVSGTKYTGFEKLTEKIIDIATGRDKVNSRYAVFHGHVGAQIPRMFLEVRQAVRTLRDKFKVVEWGYFINQLKEKGLTNDDYISEALHFLTNIGELSYFGGVSSNPRKENARGYENPPLPANSCTGETNDDDGEKPSDASWEVLDDDDDIDDDRAVLSMDETSITALSTEDGSITTVEDYMTSGLSQFVFLNPRWLVAAVACILRHDLDNEIKETRRLLASGTLSKPVLDRTSSFEDTQLNCPVITTEDACLLWQTKKITKKAAERAHQYSNNMSMSPFDFLQLLLVRFGVFVPIDATIEKAFLGGKEYAGIMGDVEADSMLVDVEKKPVSEVNIERASEAALKAKFFFLPSLLGPGEPSEAWTYKNTDSWKTTLCHSVLFPDGVPPGLMERLTANVLSAIYAVCNQSDGSSTGSAANDGATYEGRLAIREVLCWRTAFFIKLGTILPSSDGTNRESAVEIFATLADRDSRLCVGSDYMGVGMRRLIICGRGQSGDGGRKIWKGGYLLVCKCVRRVMEGYGGLEFEEQGFCPECLSKRSINEASSWQTTAIRTAVRNAEGTMRCQHGHRVDTRFVAGPVDSLLNAKNVSQISDPDPVVPVRNLLGAVVVVGLWDGKTGKIVRVGSGFIVDRRRGLIVTASHTLMNIWGDKNYPFGDNYYGLRQGKVVIGVIPKGSDTESSHGRDMAVFRYFAKVVAKDPSMENGECHIDACVLRITTRLENDVGGDGEGCGDEPEILLLNDQLAMKNEELQSLKITENVELEEQVRILGYNQGGEGLLGPGESLNRFVDFARGYVCKKFASGEQERSAAMTLRDRFKPREEIAVICPTIGGHSGGPCLNQQGEVIGILSRADPAESQRCYISPTSEWKPLIKIARKTI